MGLHNWWIAVPLLTVGALAWTSFLHAGLRARRPRWLAMAALCLGVLVAAFVADSIAGQTDPSETLAGLTLFGLAGAGFATLQRD